MKMSQYLAFNALKYFVHNFIIHYLQVKMLIITAMLRFINYEEFLGYKLAITGFFIASS